MTRPVWHRFRCPTCGQRAEVKASPGAALTLVCQCGLDPNAPYPRGRLAPKQMTPEEAS